MIIDVTGTILIPGNNSQDCAGNGEHFDEEFVVMSVISICVV